MKFSIRHTNQEIHLESYLNIHKASALFGSLDIQSTSLRQVRLMLRMEFVFDGLIQCVLSCVAYKF